MARARPMAARERPDRFSAAGEKPAGGVRWRLVLVWLLRLLSLVWLMQGLSAWATIFGVGPNAEPAFEGRLLSFQAITVYFAVFDLVAAVGLWLTSTWGGVLWLLAVTSQLLLGFLFPQHLAVGPVLAGSYACLIGAYVLASWAAANEAG